MVKMGFIGAGTIAVTMANTIKEMDCVEAYAVSARDLKRAQDFAEKYGFEKEMCIRDSMRKDQYLKLKK